MNELYSIMRDLLEVEYNQKSLLCIMETLAAAYSGEEQGEASLTVNGARYYLAVLQEDLRVAISRLDTYMAEGAKEQQQ